MDVFVYVISSLVYNILFIQHLSN